MSKPTGRPQKLTDAEKRYVQKAFALRAKLTNKALARKLGVSTRTIMAAVYPYNRTTRVPRGASVLVSKLLQRIST